jgi:hypothetical protein
MGTYALIRLENHQGNKNCTLFVNLVAESVANSSLFECERARNLENSFDRASRHGE